MLGLELSQVMIFFTPTPKSGKGKEVSEMEARVFARTLFWLVGEVFRIYTPCYSPEKSHKRSFNVHTLTP